MPSANRLTGKVAVECARPRDSRTPPTARHRSASAHQPGSDCGLVLPDGSQGVGPVRPHASASDGDGREVSLRHGAENGQPRVSGLRYVTKARPEVGRGSTAWRMVERRRRRTSRQSLSRVKPNDTDECGLALNDPERMTGGPAKARSSEPSSAFERHVSDARDPEV